jgi:hypothetical protein
LKDWWSQQGKQFPLYRVNRLGLPAKIFNVQWLGDLADIQKILLKSGWEVAPKRDWLRVLYRITAVHSTEHLPLFSPTYLDSAPVLVLLKVPKGTNKLLVLRFWNSYLRINHASQPLWMGSIEFAPSTYSWLFQKKHKHEKMLTPTLLFGRTPSHITVKQTIVSVKINDHFVNQPIILIQSTKTKKE